jgi:hypothetical protein
MKLNPRLIIINITLLLALQLSAQEDTGRVNLMWGEDLYLETKNVIPSIIGYDSTGYYSLVDDYNWAIEYECWIKNKRTCCTGSFP